MNESGFPDGWVTAEAKLRAQMPTLVVGEEPAEWIVSEGHNRYGP